MYSVLDKESVDLKVLVPSNKFRCKTSLLTAVRTRREQYIAFQTIFELKASIKHLLTSTQFNQRIKVGVRKTLEI